MFTLQKQNNIPFQLESFLPRILIWASILDAFLNVLTCNTFWSVYSWSLPVNIFSAGCTAISNQFVLSFPPCQFYNPNFSIKMNIPNIPNIPTKACFCVPLRIFVIVLNVLSILQYSAVLGIIGYSFKPSARDHDHLIWNAIIFLYALLGLTFAAVHLFGVVRVSNAQ